jgi:VWFA-related protein
MNARRRLRLVLLVCLGASLLQAFGLVQAAGLTLTIKSTDATQFPKVITTIGMVDSLDIPIDLVGRGVDRSAVTLTEDNAPISDFQIEPAIDPHQAFAVAILVDSSSGTNDTGNLAATKKALSAFIDEMGQEDSIALVSFSDQVKVLQGYTSDKNTLKQSIEQLSANGHAAIFDAISQAAQFQAVITQKRKVLLVVTNGSDTASKQSQAAATSAAVSAHVPIYAIGIGPTANHQILDEMAGNTTGQVVYVAGATDLIPAFQGFADRLRRLWTISYTSKIAGDNKTHNLGISVKEPDQTLTGQTTFTAKSNALSFQVSGIVNATRVTATPAVTVTLQNGQATKFQLLVDNQERQSLTSPPYVFQWDTSKETPGIHTVVIRAIGTDGTPTDREFVVEVIAPTPVVAPTATSASGGTATATPVVTTTQQSSTSAYIIGGLVALVVVGAAAAAFLIASRRLPIAKVPPPQVPPKPPIRDDATEVIPGKVSDETVGVGTGAGTASNTVVQAAPVPPRQLRGRLRLSEQGTVQEFTIEQPETVLGRDPKNPIVVHDPMASRRHARIVAENGEFWIEDLQSLNGTKVNGEAVTRHKLANGDQITIGAAVITFIPLS